MCFIVFALDNEQIYIGCELLKIKIRPFPILVIS